jgi:fluoride exporter
MVWIAVVLGGAIGSAARHGVSMASVRLLGNPGPLATATVNMVGSLLIGVLAGAIAGRHLTMSGTTRAFIFVGILGGFTTFSSFMLDSLTLLEANAPGRALVNVAGQLILGCALVYVGYRLGLGSVVRLSR